MNATTRTAAPAVPLREKMDEILRVRCTTRLKNRVTGLAALRGCDDADVVREAVLIHLDEEEKRRGVAEEGGNR